MKEITLKDGKIIAENEKNSKGVLHNVFIIDASGSMNQSSWVDGKSVSKYEVAMNGINNEVKKLKEDDRGDVKISVYEFDSLINGQERITEHYSQTLLSEVNKIKFRGASGNTPLYQTVGYVLEKFLMDAGKNDTVLIKIFTDGQHNCHWGKYTQAECKKLIKHAEDKRDFIISFIGTEEDTQVAVKGMGISIGNTVTYDGSSSGATMAFASTTNSTSKLLKSRRSGEDIDKMNFIKTTTDSK